MIQIRQGVFETNSSSTHSICIPKKCDKIINHVDFRIGEYGWENDEADPASYLYTGTLYAYEKDKAQEIINKIANILSTNGISFTFEKPKWNTWGEYQYLENGYVDHGEQLIPFIQAVVNDEDTLLRYLSKGIVYTGNDNESELKCYAAYEYLSDSYIDADGRWHDKEIPNPYHDSENYDYFFKGN